MGRRTIEIRIVPGSLLEVEADAVVNAANSLGIMGGGVAGALKRAAGEAVEEEARRHAPIPVGTAVATSGGATRFRAIIHAPTMPSPGMRIPADNVGRATSAALAAAERGGFASVAFPGLGTGVGGVAPAEAARRMIDAIDSFEGRTVRLVTLIDLDPDMVRAWSEALGSGEGRGVGDDDGGR
ncbi:macro domain-containing protein [Candidatus Nitrospira bockiana]